MRLLGAVYGVASIGAASAAWGPGYPFPHFPGPFCPTVTAKSVCSTCMTYLCAQISTVHNPFYCPTAIPTETAVYPCGRECPPPGCATHYVYPSRASATSTAPPSTTTATTEQSATVTPPPSCTPTVTVSVYPHAGCAISSCQSRHAASLRHDAVRLLVAGPGRDVDVYAGLPVDNAVLCLPDGLPLYDDGR